MPKPSPIQYHATIMVTIFLVLVGLGAFALFSHHGVGPFTGRAVHTEYRSDGTFIVEVTVRNDGSKQSRANCRVVPFVGRSFSENPDTVLTSVIPSHGSVRFSDVLHGVQAKPTNVLVTCS
jgi:hypothetical protein